MTIYLRGAIWHADIGAGTRRWRASLRTSDRVEAERREAELKASIPEFAVRGAEWVFTDKWIGERIAAMRYRRKGRWRQDCMTADELRGLVARSDGRCELTGIAFTDERPRGCKRAPFAPSIDRIDHTKGYSFANCRLVCFGVNVALNQWGELAFRAMAVGMLSHKKATLQH